jgi:hypothetical protein
LLAADYNGDDSKSGVKFLYKKKIFLKDEDRELHDLTCRHLLYSQAVQSFVDGEFGVNNDDVADLVALQLLATGIPIVAEDCRVRMPKSAWTSRRSPVEWVTAVERANAALKDMSSTTAEARLVLLVRRLSPIYGVTMFGAARLTAGVLKKHKVECAGLFGSRLTSTSACRATYLLVLVPTVLYL